MADANQRRLNELANRGMVPMTRKAELAQGLGRFAANLEPISESIITAPKQGLEALIDYFNSPSKQAEELASLANRDGKDGIASKLLGVDLADLPETGVGRPDMAELVRSYTKDGNIGGSRIPLGEAGLLSKPYPAHLSNAKAKEQAKRMFLANRSGLSNYIAPDREPSSPEEIQALIDNASKTKDLSKVLPISDSVDGPTPGELLGGAAKREAEEKALANQEASFDRKAEDAFVKSVANLTESDAPTTSNREELIDKYKQEFADATGLKIDGNVDRSDAMIAFGLELMKNKAGKGFNVGKIASAVGEAGTTALPILREAKNRATQAKIASGKYALQMIKSDEDASASIESANKAFQRERYLKLLQMDADFEKERIKAGAKPVDIKNPYPDKIINGLEVRRGRGPIGSVFVAPEDALRDVAGALKSVNGALTTVDQMSGLVTSLANDESPSFEVIKETVESALVGAGLADAEIVFGDSKVGRNQQIRLLQDSIITQFKRMLTQETGNGISKSDVDNIRTMLGEINFLSNPQDALLRLKEVKTLFSGKRKAVRGVLDELQDPDYYPTTREYEKNMDLYPSLIEGSMEYSISNNQGSSIIDVKDS